VTKLTNEDLFEIPEHEGRIEAVDPNLAAGHQAHGVAGPHGNRQIQLVRYIPSLCP
jgi:hypothetical protein